MTPRHTQTISRADGSLATTVSDMPSPRNFQPMNAFARLILSRKEELGLTWVELGKRADMAHSVAYALATKKVHKQPPRGDTIERLARALELDPQLLRAAAADAAGLNLPEMTTKLEAAEDVQVVVRAMQDMQPPDRAKLRRLALAFVEDSRELSEEQVTIRAELDADLAAAPGPNDEQPGDVRPIRTRRARKR